MKKIITCLALFFLFVGSYAQNVDKFMSELAQEHGADNVKVGGFLFSLMKPFVSVDSKDKEAFAFCKGIKSIQVVDVSNCNEEKRSNYLSMLNNLRDENGYETLMKVKNKEENVHIMMKQKKDKIEGLYIFCIDKNDISAVKLTGNFNKEDIDNLMNKYDN